MVISASIGPRLTESVKRGNISIRKRTRLLSSPPAGPLGACGMPYGMAYGLQAAVLVPDALMGPAGVPRLSS